MPCPYSCNNTEGNGPPRPVTIEEIRMMIHDMNEPYSVSDAEIEQAIKFGTIIGKVEYNVSIDPKTQYPATDLDAYIISLLAVIQLLENITIQIRGGGGGNGGNGGVNGASSSGACGGAVYNAFIDSISEGGSSISFMSLGDIQSILDRKREELERLKIGKWGCAIYVTTGNY